MKKIQLRQLPFGELNSGCKLLNPVVEISLPRDFPLPTADGFEVVNEPGVPLTSSLVREYLRRCMPTVTEEPGAHMPDLTDAQRAARKAELAKRMSEYEDLPNALLTRGEVEEQLEIALGLRQPTEVAR